jgi:hypothetical protein
VITIRASIKDVTAAVNAIKARAASIQTSIPRALDAGALVLAARIKRNLNGAPGFPQWRTGRLQRGIVAVPAAPVGDHFEAAVGPVAQVPYGKILELGGTVPEHDIYPRIKRVLAWPNSGFALMAHENAMLSRKTPKQAQAAAIRASRRGNTGGFAFAMHVHQKSRFQRAIPYLAPSYQEAKGDVAVAIRSRLLRVVRAGQS